MICSALTCAQVLLDIPHHPRKHKKRKKVSSVDNLASSSAVSFAFPRNQEIVNFPPQSASARSRKAAEQADDEFGSEADDFAAGGEDVSMVDDVAGGGGGLLQKSAKSFLKRMSKAFAGGGGNGGARREVGADDTWDAAQTVSPICLIANEQNLKPECFLRAATPNPRTRHGGTRRS
jgi:hypothetical protein